MAVSTVSSSDESSSRAPDNFCLSSNCETHNNSLKCHLCKRYSKNFICANCIKTGSFFHSSHHLPEKLYEKQVKYENLKQKLNDCEYNCNKILEKFRLQETLKYEIKQKQEKIAILNHLIKSTKEKIIERKKYSDSLKNSNSYQRNILPKYKDKVKNLEDYVSDRLQQIERLKEQKNQIIDDVKVKTQSEIQKLIAYIFPITEILSKDELSTTDSSSSGGGFSDNHNTPLNITDLSSLDKTHLTTAKRSGGGSSNNGGSGGGGGGKWILPGTTGINELQYRIVGPSLPASGDYSIYMQWLKENKNDQTSGSTSTSLTSLTAPAAYRILAALTYTTQLLNILSYYLDVRLPNKLAYADFTRRLNEQQFTKRVSRLNSNIMYLAYSQRVKLSATNENHTLENLLAIVSSDNMHLGNIGPNFINDAPSMNSIDSILIGVDTATESESEDENSLRLDWEAVSPNITSQGQEMHHPCYHHQQTIGFGGGAAGIFRQNQPQSTPQQSNQQTTSIMANAANSIASIFRGWRT